MRFASNDDESTEYSFQPRMYCKSLAVKAENSSKAQHLGTINSAAFLLLACLQRHAMGISKSWAKLYTKTDRPARVSLRVGVEEMMCSVQCISKT